MWLLHWQLQTMSSSNGELNASRFFFNYFNGIKVRKESLSNEISDALAKHEKTLTEATLNKDIDCFLQMYAHKSLQSSKVNEDSFASPFTELGLLKQEDAKLSCGALKANLAPRGGFCFCINHLY
ncbi:DUF4007 family protein [Plesiomonas shigelloides subsp. oncorhynchi]|nr:DUF4007 family protein [Plesiomonas shigelloides]